MFDLAELAQRLQRLRAERGLSLAGLGERCSVSVSMLSAIERAAKAPTVVVLARIADGLEVSLTALLEDASDRRLVVRRRDEQESADHADGWRRVVLSPVVAGVNFELVRLTLPPHCDAGEFPAYARGSHEYLAVEEGTLQLTIGERTVLMEAGDSAYFEADQLHRFANPADVPCAYYLAAMIMRPRP
ncbi:helix-turn-helix domain-containing protein [Amycolatopsis sp. H20-H5]|uniref:helix-turn-helix domain-containing protein n=1 Tax=Amycolatopsis sp. H20-H5 TaxID=3046309 RepID=UPI002DB577A7|nr:XRE family transcriptional regulator [Amycolatopsis sp. H20-H5]MEC3977843.1 XRE family transcriptional regulator [Amycolatopsis sp. H20-H5]